MSDSPFDYGARYRVKADFEALRDRFVAGEELIFDYATYSAYDGVYGCFFRDLSDGRWRSWDPSSLAGWAEHFERVGDPDPLIAAAEAGDRRALGQHLATLDADAGEGQAAAILVELAAKRAVEAGQAEALADLLAGDRLDDPSSLKLLHHAAREAPRAAVLATLLDAGLSVDARDSAGQTPLHHAAASAPVELVAFLLERGADPNARTKAEVTPLRLAKARRREQVVALLEAAGATS